MSHHDLMRCCERMLRRAALPFKSTAGFHPTPRLVFALSLSLGVVGLNEVVELELTEPRDSEEVLAILNSQSPPGLTFTHVSLVPMKATALPRRMVYELPLPTNRVAELQSATQSLMAESRVWVERLKPSPKRLNIRPYFRSLRVDNVPGSPESGRLILDIWVTQTGSARADELLELLRVSDLLETGTVLERTLVEIRDEVTVNDPNDSPPDGPADSVPLTGAEIAALVAQRDEEANQQLAEAGWGASPNGPVVE